MKPGELSAYLTGRTTHRRGSNEALAAGRRREGSCAIAKQIATMLAAISSVWHLGATQAAAVLGALPSGLDADGPRQTGPRGKPDPRAIAGVSSVRGTSISLGVDLRGSNGGTVDDALDCGCARRGRIADSQAA